MSIDTAGGALRRRIITRQDVEAQIGIPVATQAVWRVHNRYGFRDLTIKVGRSVRYDQADIDAWVESRKGRVEVSA
jgi:predicted DNA-binding transcriptional regulator AlpA